MTKRVVFFRRPHRGAPIALVTLYDSFERLTWQLSSRWNWRLSRWFLRTAQGRLLWWSGWSDWKRTSSGMVSIYLPFVWVMLCRRRYYKAPKRNGLTIRRAAFEKLDPWERMGKIREGYALTD